MAFVLREGLQGGGGGVGGDTDVLVRRLPGRTKSLIRLPVPVDPETAVDQAFNIDGHAAQVYHLTEHVRVVTALVPGDGESWPRTPGVLRVAMGEGAVPAEAGTFPSINLSGMNLILTIDGVQFSATLAAAIHEDKVAPIGPSHRNQSGPDLLRRKHYLLQLKRASIGGAAGTETQDYVTVADVHVTTRVDMELAVVEVLWMAGRWKSTNNPFASNPSCGGPLYFDHLRIDRATLPSGWGVELFAPHPYSSFDAGNILALGPMGGPNEVHWISSTGQYSFRFATYNPATVSQPTARKVLDGWDRGFAVSGPLSFHQRHGFGERLDLILDLQHFDDAQGAEVQWRDPLNPNLDAWLAMDALATTAANEFRGQHANPTNPSRKGWLFGLYLDSPDGAGGDGINGTSAHFQGRAHFENTLLRLDSLVTRSPLGMIDVVDGRALNDSKLAANNSSSWTTLTGTTPGLVGSVPYIITAGLDRSSWVHPHFVPSYVDVGSWGGSNPAQFRLAPLDRPWSEAPSGKSCPYRDSIDWQKGGNRWPPFDLAHASRWQDALRDAVWLYDDPIAHRLLEEIVTTRCTLAYSRFQVAGVINESYHLGASNLPYIAANNSAPPRHGAWKTPQSGGGYFEGDNLRNLAWPLSLATMYWWVATPAERARLHPAAGSGTSWFREWWRFATSTFMENGFCLRFSNHNPAPDPYDVNRFGTPNIAQRRGAYPVDGQNRGLITASMGFHVCFTVGAIFAAKNGPMKSEPDANALDSTLRVARMQNAQARANYPTGTYARPTYYPAQSGVTGIDSPPYTEQDHLNGLSAWALTDQQNGGAPIETRNFQGWPAQYGFRETGDSSLFHVLAGDNSVSVSSPFALFVAMRDRYVQLWTDGNFRKQATGDHTWWLGALAEMIYLRNVPQ